MALENKGALRRFYRSAEKNSKMINFYASAEPRFIVAAPCGFSGVTQLLREIAACSAIGRLVFAAGEKIANGAFDVRG